MRKLLQLLIAFSLSLTLTGCVEKYIYVKAECPHIEVLTVVGPLNGDIDANGSIHEPHTTELLKGCSDLRKSETYYFEQVSAYNLEYNTSK